MNINVLSNVNTLVIIKRDDKYIEELETAQKAFWSYVLTKTEPDKNS